MAKKTRKELQNSFKQGAKPSGDDFKDLIDSTLNITDDGIEKGSGTDPLKIKANGAEENLVDFYTGETNTWRINQKPGSDKQGLNLSTSGSSKLFIESSSGNVGISTNKPTAKLHVQQTSNEDALRVDDESGDNTPFIVNKDGNVGIGIANPSEKLEIKLTGGDRQQTNFLSLFNDGGGAAQESRIVWKNGSEKKYAAAIASRPGSLYNAGDLRFQTASAGILKEQMIIGTTGNVGIGTTSPAAKLSVNGGLHVGGDSDPGDNNLLVDGNIYSSINSSQQRNYEIYLRGSAMESTEGDNNDVQINNKPIETVKTRGINTVILYPNGTIKNKANHDLWANPNLWNDWADWVNANVTDGDIVAVTSRDAINNAPRDGSAEKLLNSIVAIEAFQCVKGNGRSPYALLFIKGRTGAIEVSRRFREGNAHIRTTYYHLLNNSSGSVISGMIIMWYGDINNIPIGWVLCDGQNGTPDLRSRFIVGAGTGGNPSYQPGQSGEADQHNHSIDIPPQTFNTNTAGEHSHSFPSGWYKRDYASYAAVTNGRYSGIDTGGADVAQQTVNNNGGHSHSVTVDYPPLNSTTSSDFNRPKWYALCLIMKL